MGRAEGKRGEGKEKKEQEGGKERGKIVYSGAPLNRHLSTADTHDIKDNFESPDCPCVHFSP